MRALFIGRFQPFHLGHLRVIREISRKYEPIIVIGSSEESHTLENPFTAGERYEMISEALAENEISKFIVIPVRDVNRYSIWVEHVRSMIPEFNVVYGNNPLTMMLFNNAGYEIKETKYYSRKKYSGFQIRKMMITGKPWKSLVPKAIYNHILKIHGQNRLMKLNKNDMPVFDNEWEQKKMKIKIPESEEKNLKKNGHDQGRLY